MQTFLRVDINIIAIILLTAVYMIANMRLDKKDYLNATFLQVSGIIALELAIETTTCIINKRPGTWLIPLSNILHILLFSIAPVLTYYWYVLVKSLITTPQKKKNKLRTIVSLLPVIINFVLTLLSPSYHLIFYIDQNNVYKRGPLFIVFGIATYVYFLASFFYIIKYKNRIMKREFYIYFIFGILPMSGGIIQGFFYGPLLMWSTVAFSLVITYVFLQQRMIHLDHLSGAWDRGSFEYYMLTRLGRNDQNKSGLVYMDIDELKKINDQYGHVEGDFTIKQAIACIRKVLRKSDIIVRMGGDEFIIILDCDVQEAMNKIIRKMEDSITSYNQQSGKTYRIACSFGGAIYDPNKSSIEDFLNHIDRLMYQNKSLKRKM